MTRASLCREAAPLPHEHAGCASNTCFPLNSATRDYEEDYVSGESLCGRRWLVQGRHAACWGEITFPSSLFRPPPTLTPTTPPRPRSILFPALYSCTRREGRRRGRSRLGGGESSTTASRGAEHHISISSTLYRCPLLFPLRTLRVLH